MKMNGKVTELPKEIIDEILDHINEVKNDEKFGPGAGMFKFEDKSQLILLDDSIVYYRPMSNEDTYFITRVAWDYSKKT